MSENKHIETTLSIHPEWDLSQQEIYVYQFQHQQLPPMEKNQLQIVGNKLEDYEDFFVVTAYVRSTLDKEITFEVLNLVILDEDQNTLARKRFDMEIFGNLPPFSSRPWKFLFHKEDNEHKSIPTEGWTIAFELEKRKEETKHELMLDASWEKSVTDEQKQYLRELVEKLPPLKENEVNFIGIQAKFTDQGGLATTLLIRNGSAEAIRLEELPLQIMDAQKNVVASGSFKLNDFIINANTSKPWTFIFPQNLLENKNPDLSKWTAQVPR
ncbi:accessory Sec system S-layer assembly protein [Lederbergia citri]|uniref:Accessory Sec system S-layer assembly protein n=1 Tax=Lederbergia citri TaxID=2833580 RepID=A0A942YHF9_9BACI|nr:accessory Sec system S-layer assembly protein [Lederbergia citri]MBS4195739.1 accessory Sec system S-layer assembly protein [Lederbergia citri]